MLREMRRRLHRKEPRSPENCLSRLEPGVHFGAPPSSLVWPYAPYQFISNRYPLRWAREQFRLVQMAGWRSPRAMMLSLRENSRAARPFPSRPVGSVCRLIVDVKLLRRRAAVNTNGRINFLPAVMVNHRSHARKASADRFDGSESATASTPTAPASATPPSSAALSSPPARATGSDRDDRDKSPPRSP
jgi:hypothetical protein